MDGAANLLAIAMTCLNGLFNQIRKVHAIYTKGKYVAFETQSHSLGYLGCKLVDLIYTNAKSS